MKFEKQYKITIKPTAKAFTEGKTTYTKIIPESFLSAAISALERDETVERYFYEETTQSI